MTDQSNILSEENKSQNAQNSIIDNNYHSSEDSQIQKDNQFDNNVSIRFDKKINSNRSHYYSNKNDILYSQLYRPKKKRYEYLYENSKILLAKKDFLQREKESNEIKRMKPEISTKAKQIQRNPNLFAMRLYPGTDLIHKKIMIEDEEDIIQERDLYGNNQQKYKKIYQKHGIKKADDKPKPNEVFSFQPSFNKNSLEIASKLSTNSKDRLFMQKLNISKLDLSSPFDNYYTPDNPIKIKRLCITPPPNSRVLKLYDQAMKSIKKKRELIHQKNKEHQKAEGLYSFKPFINQNFIPSKKESLTLTPNNESSNSNNLLSVYNRTSKWKEEVESQTEKVKSQIAQEEKENCPFKPRVNKKINFNYNNRNQIGCNNNYVRRRQASLLQKTQEEEKKNRKCVDYSTEKSKKRTFIKSSYSAVNLNKETKTRTFELTDRQDDIQTQRNKLGLEEYFSEIGDYNQEVIDYFKPINIQEEQKYLHATAFAHAIDKIYRINVGLNEDDLSMIT